MPRTTTAISLVAADGGNNRIQFDPFLVQVIRVVDSSNNQLCLEAVTPTTSVATLSKKQFGHDGMPATALGHLMHSLGVTTLPELSHMIRPNEDGKPVSPSWVQVYRDLVEWAVLYTIVSTKDFGTDTLIVVDGLLRSKVFAGLHFRRLLDKIQTRIDSVYSETRRRIYLVGVAKHSSVLARYRLAMALENVLNTEYPAYVEVPRDLEESTYRWSEFARGNDREQEGREPNRFVGGKMHFVKFGASRRDPIWPIDVFEPQVEHASSILGYMLADATNGFPIPHYPLCLQKAHENAAMVDFDFDMVQEHVFAAIRDVLGDDAPNLDAFRLQAADPAQARYR